MAEPLKIKVPNVRLENLPPNAVIPNEFRPSPLPQRRTRRKVRRYQKPRAPPSSPVTPPFNMRAFYNALNFANMRTPPGGEYTPSPEPTPKVPKPWISNTPTIPQYQSAAYGLLHYLGTLYGPRKAINSVTPENQLMIVNAIKHYINTGAHKYLHTSMYQTKPGGEQVGVPGMEDVSIGEFLFGLKFDSDYTNEMYGRLLANFQRKAGGRRRKNSRKTRKAKRGSRRA